MDQIPVTKDQANWLLDISWKIILWLGFILTSLGSLIFARFENSVKKLNEEIGEAKKEWRITFETHDDKWRKIFAAHEEKDELMRISIAKMETSICSIEEDCKNISQKIHSPILDSRLNNIESLLFNLVQHDRRT